MLRACEVTAGYGERVVLRGVDFAVGRGELCAVIGPNGSGKSTLLRVLGAGLRPSAGRVELQGHDVAALGHRERARRIAVVPQSLDVVPRMLVADFVAGGRYAHRGFFARATALDADAIERGLRHADVADCRDRRLDELSGGQRQRVLVARALAQQAEVLLCDEPTAALDPEHQIAVGRLLRGLRDRGHAVVLATHELGLASQFADRVVLLDDGRKVADGAVGEVLCEVVLAPVYGRALLYGRFPGDDGRPLIVPWARR